MDQRLLGCEAQVEQEPLRRAVGEATPDRQHDVGRFERGSARVLVREHAGPERLRLADGAAPHHRGDHRRAQPSGQRRSSSSAPALDHAAARDDERAPRPRQPLRRRRRCAVDVAGGRRPWRRRSARRPARRAGRSAARSRRARAGRCASSANAPLDRRARMSRPRPTVSAHRHTGRKQSIWFGTSWSAPTSRPISAAAMSDMSGEHGLRARVRLGQRGQHIGRARPRGDDDDARPPRRRARSRRP